MVNGSALNIAQSELDAMRIIINLSTTHCLSIAFTLGLPVNAKQQKSNKALKHFTLRLPLFVHGGRGLQFTFITWPGVPRAIK